MKKMKSQYRTKWAACLKALFLLSQLCLWSHPELGSAEQASLRAFLQLRGLDRPALSAPVPLKKLSANQLTARQSDPNWDTPFFAKGPSDMISSLAIQGAQVIVGGAFHGADDQASRGVALWDGARWNRLGDGLQPDVLSTVSTAYDLAFDGQGGFYAAGLFGKAGSTGCRGVAHWDGLGWRCLALDLEFEPQLTSLEILNGQVHAAGYHGVLKWNGAQWDSLVPMIRGEVTRMRNFGGKLCVAGRITVDGDTTVRNLVFREGGKWVGLGGGPGPVRDLAMSGKDLFVIESYRKANRTDSTAVMHWSGSAWARVDDVLPKCVFTNLAADSQDVYLIGEDREVSKLRIFKWDGKGFMSYRTDNFFGVTTEARLVGGKLYLAGSFPGIGTLRADNLAVWDGAEWKAVSSGTGGGPYQIAEALESNGKNLYLGGRFIRYGGGIPAAGVLRWDGLSWDNMAGGFRDKSPFYGALDMTVRALAFRSDTVYAGGYFDSSQSAATRNIAQWDGKSWLPMGNGFPGVVHDLEDMGFGLVVGGKPDTGMAAGPASPLRGQAVGLWTDGTWKTLGAGLTGEVRKLAYYKGDLYAAGKVKLEGGDSSCGIVRWFGNQWIPVPPSGSGFRLDSVFGVTVFKDELYFLGWSRFRPKIEHNLAKWNGKNFSEMHMVVQSTSLAADENYLYMSMLSSRQEVPQLVESTLARWNVASGWQSLTSEMGGLTYFSHGEVLTLNHTLAVHGDYLYVSSLFSTLNGKPAYCFARWNRSGIISIKPVARGGRKARDIYLEYLSNNGTYGGRTLSSSFRRFDFRGKTIHTSKMPVQAPKIATSILINVSQ